MRRIIAIEHPLETETPTDRLLLDFDLRNRRRMVLTTQAGEALLLDMARAVHMRGGDRARLDDGAIIAIEAADEALIEIAAADSAALVRIAWHLGNRHLPTQLVAGENGGSIRIREDHVIRAMAEGLGGRCSDVAAPFDPEGGAYAGLNILAQSGHGHSHSHHHDHDHGDDGHHHHAHR